MFACQGYYIYTQLPLFVVVVPLIRRDFTMRTLSFFCPRGLGVYKLFRASLYALG